MTALLLAPSGMAQTDQLAPTWTTIVPPPLGPSEVELEFAAELDDGSFIVVGRDGWTAVLLRYGPDGQRLSLAKVRDFYDWSATIDPAGAVVISGISFHPFGDYFVMRYDTATGRPRWRSAALLEGRRRELDRLLPHAIDPSGNVLALQLDCEESTKATCSSGAWSVVKLDRGSGNQLWAVPELPGVGGAGDIPISVKTDPAGDVLVLGLASNQQGNGEWVVFKLDGQTGELAWGPVRMGLTPSSDSSPALLLPSTDGSVYVVGHVYAGSRCLLAVARLDGKTGQQAWGPAPVANGSQRFDPVQISLDPAGDLLVLERGGLLLKLRKADGEVLWAAPPQVENKHRGTYRRSAPSIVVDGQGDIWLLGWGAVNRYLKLVWGATKYNGRTGAMLAQHRAELDENEIETSPGPAFISRQGRLVVTSWIQKPYVTSEPSYEIAVSYLDASSGDTVWGPIRAEVGSSNWGEPLAVETPEGDVVVGDHLGVNITRVSVADGTVTWGPIGRGQLGLGHWRLRSVHVAGGGHLVLVGQDGESPMMLPSLLALDAGSGEKRWGPVALPEQLRGEYPLRGSATNADGLVLLAVFQRQGNLARPNDAMGQSNEEERAEPPGRLEAFAFDGSTGAFRWGPRLVSDTVWNAGAWFLVAADPYGDFVASTGAEPGGSRVIKLRGANGDRLWESRVEGMWIVHVAVDHAGDVLVVGSRVASRERALVKLSGADGGTVWGPVVEWGPLLSARAGLLTIAPDNDILVAGSEERCLSAGAVESWVVARYESGDGSRVWGPATDDVSECLGRHSSTGGGRLHSLRLDALGGMLAIGNVDSENGSYWLATKHSAATGDLIWSRRFFFADAYTGQATIGARDHDVVVTLPTPIEHYLQRLTTGLTLDLARGRLPPAQTGVAYTFELPARNGEPPLRFRLASGALPRGFKLDRRSGTIAGTSTEEGAWHFDVEVTDESESCRRPPGRSPATRRRQSLDR